MKSSALVHQAGLSITSTKSHHRENSQGDWSKEHGLQRGYKFENKKRN